jgi:hypothetical protein
MSEGSGTLPRSGRDAPGFYCQLPETTADVSVAPCE